MPVSYLPLIVPLLLIGVPIVFRLFGGKRAGTITAAISVLLVAVVLLSIYVPGCLLMVKASRGDPRSQYQLAKWCENHSERIGTIILWPCEPDVKGGYAWLEKAADQDYPPALYAVGVRLKYGDFVPMPKGWSGPAGNWFPQPARGQTYIDEALKLGYEPVVEERLFYRHVFRGMYVKDPYD